jgi:Ca2+/Na+ antiporter
MKKFNQITTGLHTALLSKKAKHGVEKLVFVAAFAGFFLHLGLIMLANWGIIQAEGMRGLSSPVEALYTPFSIILFYEVYCLIYFLPKSITHYVGLQFEIMALILIRAAFDEMSELKLVSDIGEMFKQQDFLYLLITIFLLFGLIYLFYRVNQDRIRKENSNNDPDLANVAEYAKAPPKWYEGAKRKLALFMGVLFVILSLVTLYHLAMDNDSLLDFMANSRGSTKEFFVNIFTILIVCDVIILLLSFAVTHDFHRVMRNSGFVISTILLKLSFSIEGVASYFLVIVAALFAIGILAVFKLSEKIEMPEE